MDLDPDLELVRALADGDPETQQRALTDLYVRHQRRVMSVAYRVLGNWSEAEDVAQEVFLNLSRSVRSFRGDASFRSWIYRIAVNRAIDSRRRDARRPTSRLPDTTAGMELNLPSGRSGTIAPDEGVRRDEHAEQVQQALGRLSPKLRAVAVLRYVEGLSYEDLAEVLNCSIGTIKSRLNRAHTALARELGPGVPPKQPGGEE